MKSRMKESEKLNKKTKWMLYEKRCQFRAFYFHKIIRRHICEKYLNFDPVMHFYANQWIMGKNKTNQWIAHKIRSGEPFMVARFGNTELSVMTSVLKQRICGNSPSTQARFDKWFHRLNEGAGFFPPQPELAEKFTDLMLESCKSVDLLAMWHCEMDDFVITEYMKHAELSFLFYLEPWRCKKPWSAALCGKKVLVIHPFEESIQQQYKKRKLLFPRTEVLPDFELITLKAVQTIAGEKDDRFDTWFDALEYMYEEAMKKEFDIAIIGCGAYGFPLAAKLKDAGKQVIHLGGVTQIMFGIKGSRWVNNPRRGFKFNDAWMYPRESETPKNSKVVEDSCYW